MAIFNSGSSYGFFLTIGHNFFWVSEEKKQLSPSQYYIINLKNIYLSPSIKTFTLYTKNFVFSTENNCNIIYEGEQLLINLVRLTAKEEKIAQYDVIHTRLYLFKMKGQFECVHK